MLLERQCYALLAIAVTASCAMTAERVVIGEYVPSSGQRNGNDTSPSRRPHSFNQPPWPPTLNPPPWPLIRVHVIDSPPPATVVPHRIPLGTCFVQPVQGFHTVVIFLAAMITQAIA